MLVINQGKQDTSKDGKFDVIKEKGVFGKISEVKMHDSFDNTLSICIDIIDNDNYKGKKVWDNVSFDPKSDFAWKYRSLRACVGMPYTDGEDTKIDIEKVLLNKKVKMNLDVRTGTDGNEYQKVTYVARKTVKATEEEKATMPVEDVVKEDTTHIEQDAEW